MVDVLGRHGSLHAGAGLADPPRPRLSPAFPRPPVLPPMPDRSICLYTPSADPSGMGAHMLDLAEQYVQAGAQVSVLVWPTDPGRRMLARAQSVGAHAFALPHPRDPAFAPAITRFLQARPADVFHVHVGTGRENFDGARAARSAGAGAVVQTQHLPWLLSNPGKRVPFFAGIEQVDRIITVSVGQRETYERIGVPADRLCTVPNGVRSRGAGPGRETARRRLGLGVDQRVVLTVGRLTVMKGQRHLLDCVPGLVARIPDVRVVLVGDGHLRADLIAQAAALGVSDAVVFAGHRTDARQLLDAADVFVLPSRHEGMPLAAMEAMDAGLPVVGTRVIGTAEVVADGETGLLVKPGDDVALGAALAALLADPARRASYGLAGRRRYLTHFTSAQMAAGTVDVYEDALRAAGVGSGR